MKLSEGATRVANANFKKESDEIRDAYKYVLPKDLTLFVLEHSGRKNDILRYYIQIAEKTVIARVKSYLEVFANEGIIPDKSDIKEIILELENLIGEIGDNAPTELSSNIIGESQRIVFSAQQEVRLFCQEMKADKESQIRQNTYNNIFHSQVTGVQQGGNNNTQNNTVNIGSDITALTSELFKLIESSSASQLSKVIARTDTQAIELLNQIEQNSETLKEASTRVESIKEIVVTSAKLKASGLKLLHKIQKILGLQSIAIESKKFDEIPEDIRIQDEYLANQMEYSLRVKEFLKNDNSTVLYEGIKFNLLVKGKLITSNTFAIRNKIDRAFRKSQLTVMATVHEVFYTLMFGRYLKGFELTQQLEILREQEIEVIIIELI